jgi:hypothetical protein
MARIQQESSAVKKTTHFIKIKMCYFPHLGNFMKTPLNLAEIALAQATSQEGFGNPLELRRR